MFDLKKRNSLTLSGTLEAAEFRRVAVRRKDKGATGDCLVPDLDSGVCGSYSSGRACDSFCGTKPNSELKANEDCENRQPKTPTLKSVVAPKPAHLQRTGQDQACNPTLETQKPQQVNRTTQDPTSNKDCGNCGSCVTLQTCQGSPGPVRGGRSNFLNPVFSAHLTPGRQALGLVSRSQSPGKRSIQGCSSKEEGHSPAKLSPRNRSPLMGKLRTPSPVQKKMGSQSPARSSRSWLGLHRISSEKLERREKKAEKSLSVPDLIIYMDETRIPVEKAVCSPLKSLQSANCDGPGITIKTPAKCKLSTTDGGHICINGNELSPGQQNGVKQDKEESTENIMDEGKALRRCGSRYLCEWNKATTREESCHLGSNTENNEENERMNESGGSEPKNEDDKEQKLYKIANEFLQTERAYVARLHLLDQVFCLHLTQEADRGSFPPEVIKNIFSNISSIYSFHSQFLLPDLEHCIMHWDEGPGLGKALLQHAPFLRMYADYIGNFDRAIELVRTWTERSSTFRNIVHNIQHHMLEPVQRVPRYEMLLKDYLKKLPEENPDYELASKSLEAISMAAIHSNSAIHKAENLRRLLEIYEMVGEEVVNPTNEFLKEGRLLKLAARNTSAMERHVFLFNNFLLCCSAKFSLVGQRFTVRCRIGVDGMQAQQTTNEDYPYTFQVSGKEKTLELQASSEQERDEWIKAIQEATDVFQKKNESFKLVSKELNTEEPTKELGRRAPRWIRDNEVTLCMTCQEPFNALTRRRHHCRACGYVVCWKCSDNKVALEYDGNRLNKVCKACYSILAGQRAERMDWKKRRMLESEVYPESQDCVLSGFLQYGDNSMICRDVWCILSGTNPPFFHMYNTPQDEKPLLTLPLLSCVIEEMHNQNCFCLKESKTSYIFSCDDLDVKQNWLTVLKLTVMRSL
ncbi:FYVE, RhoGEF and PH domain-containing protein 4-like isoform X2 [Girardinichthys multiradiatus]|uniref:FYVE, RhoGEF and PH domain-containing protein 4-like isoform X2 n=1 Tax=Girardinichthys multiradiatus TaxID=208333 RepID=UPI001FACC5F0|nr:FYVE, RhoGEF and PH domain-containing protein 4-like isoform X2 [Girardinichthys multiradiatus]